MFLAALMLRLFIVTLPTARKRKKYENSNNNNMKLNWVWSEKKTDLLREVWVKVAKISPELYVPVR